MTPGRVWLGVTAFGTRDDVEPVRRLVGVSLGTPEQLWLTFDRRS